MQRKGAFLFAALSVAIIGGAFIVTTARANNQRSQSLAASCGECSLSKAAASRYALQIGPIEQRQKQKGCPKCINDTCAGMLEPGERLISDPKKQPRAKRCINHDNNRQGHCAMVECQHRWIYGIVAETGRPGQVGDCYNYYCAGATPIPDNPCLNPTEL